MYRFVSLALFLMPTAATFMPQFPVSDTSSRSSKTYALSSDVQKWVRNDKKTPAWDPVKLWDEIVSAPVRRHVEYGTPTISLGRQQNTRSNAFDDLVSSMKDSIKEANTAFRQFMNEFTSQKDATSPQALAQQGDWGAFVDEDGTGRIYYFNVVTGESRWNPPTSDFPMVNEPPRLLVSEGYWGAYVDEKKKSVYYFNRKTGQTTWNRPYPSFPRVSVNSPAHTVQRPLAVSGDWSAYLDNNKNVYYFNDVTGESTWQPPSGFPTVQAAPFVSAYQHVSKWLEDVLEKFSFTLVSADQDKDMEWTTELISKFDQQFDKATSSIRESWSFLDYFGRSKTFSANEFPIAAIVIDFVDELLASVQTYLPFLDASRNNRQDNFMQVATIYPDLEHLTRWKRNSDDTITGSVRHSNKHPVGTVITTSPAERGSTIAEQKVIRTLSGTRYYLL
ncbi:hypothetical protein FisN_5Lh401 [Fistulifera solaris]|uniref:WW domain-containing protein n=1 Tax=Fistulifera solaris TaxID=1519565 RepID=A0A1Z5KGU2_FISSO|nr:hypothetical protein FisN_5Lh401 [Fistulifera solaris]|eukprot:GAX25312.1 hypothetical protein FisN_5Lh401 [Fistulifera solaris]